MMSVLLSVTKGSPLSLLLYISSARRATSQANTFTASGFTRNPQKISPSSQRLHSRLPIRHSRPRLRPDTRPDIPLPPGLRPSLQLRPHLLRTLRRKKPRHARKRVFIRQHQRPHRIQIPRPRRRELLPHLRDRAYCRLKSPDCMLRVPWPTWPAWLVLNLNSPLSKAMMASRAACSSLEVMP
jgi:hypothetical protein